MLSSQRCDHAIRNGIGQHVGPLRHRRLRYPDGLGRQGVCATKKADGFGLEHWHAAQVSTLTELSASALTISAVPIDAMARLLKDRVALAIDAGWSVGDLAAAAGTTSSAVSQWKSGATTEIKAKSAHGLERLTGWRSEWWSSGKLPMKIGDPPQQQELWPFEGFDKARFDRLTERQKGFVEKAALEEIERLEAAAGKDRAA